MTDRQKSRISTGKETFGSLPIYPRSEESKLCYISLRFQTFGLDSIFYKNTNDLGRFTERDCEPQKPFSLDLFGIHCDLCIMMVQIVAVIVPIQNGREATAPAFPLYFILFIPKRARTKQALLQEFGPLMSLKGVRKDHVYAF